MKKNEALLYSGIGLTALFLILVAFNYLAGGAAARLDLTEGKLYTLSAGTRKLLTTLPAPVKVKLYRSKGDTVPVQLRGFAQRVEDLVEEFRAASNGKLVIERYNPRPDSDEEDAAQLDGIEAQQLFNGESIYLGIAVSQLDRKQALATITPQRERLLEYDLARAVARVAIAERPKIGVMSGLPVLGMAFNPMTRQPAEPWVLAHELKRDYDVKEIDLSATEIDKDINVLLLIHPRFLQPATEYALDQFVMRGGKLIAFVDPYAFFDQQPTMPGVPAPPSTSTVPLLFKAWGVEMAQDRVIADVVYASGDGRRYTPTVLSLNRTAMNRDDVVTSQIETLLYAFGGAFEVKPTAGLKVTELLTSSRNSMLVDASKATASGDEATRNFKPEGKARALALRLSGAFKSAFPNGRPVDDKDKDRKPAAAAAAHLAQAAAENSVVLVADVDLLADGAAVDIQEVFGRKIVVPSNGNLAFALGLLEQLSSNDALISLRSRAAAYRPLTVVRELEAEAQKQYFGKIQALESELQKTSEKLQALQKTKGAATGGSQLLTAEQQSELDSFRKRVVETRKELKDVRKNLRQDAERLVFLTKVANIALMPILVSLLGLGVALLRRRRAARAVAGT